MISAKNRFSGQEFSLKLKNGKKQQGVVLIVVLVAVLILVMLGLALLSQSETEYHIATNEQDTATSFFYSDGILQWVYRQLNDISDLQQNPDFLSFTPVLHGPECAPYTNMSCANGTTEDDFMLGFDLDNDGTSNLNVAQNLTNLNSTNETTLSVKTFTFLNGTNIDLNNDGVTDDRDHMEAFLLGINEDGTGGWDGPRALIYVRVDDNHDDGGTDNILVDTDQRVFATIYAQYPIEVTNTGISEVLRGTAVRKLIAKLGPKEKAALMTDGSLLLQGNFEVCGDCGSTHANTNTQVQGNTEICEDATSSGTYNTSGGSLYVGALGIGNEPEIFIPIVNPYNDEGADVSFVPDFDLFNTSTESVPAQIQCQPVNANDVGASKYFALVAETSGFGKVYKATRHKNGTPGDPTDDYWDWTLIDDLNNGNDVWLDDCGRVANCNGEPGCSVDPHAGTAVNPGAGDTNRFYGFNLQAAISSGTCSGTDATLSGTANNNFTGPSNCGGCPGGVVLPGAKTSDGQADFNWNYRFSVGETNSTNPLAGRWVKEASNIHSPLYHAVIFYHGNLRLAGNLSNLVHTGGTVALPGGFWRASHIAVGNILTEGSPAYAPARESFPFLLISGRDIDRGGNVSSGDPEICKGDNCSLDPVEANARYYGIIAAHEQVRIRGNAGLSGFVVAENAINCSTLVDSSVGVTTGEGSAHIYYDCNNPPYPWARGVVIQSWEEIP